MYRLLLIVLLLVGTQLATGSPVRHSGIRNFVSKNVIEKMGKMSKAIAIVSLSTALFVLPPKITRAQEEVNEDEVFMEVTANDPAHRHGVVLLRVSNPPAEGENEGEELGFHLVHIGVDDDGNSVLFGRDRPAGVDIQESLAKGGRISLYGWDGLIADNITVRAARDTFKDWTDGTFNTIALIVEGLNLEWDYPPVRLSNSFPYETVEDLELLTYKLSYSAHLTEEELAAEMLPLRWRACESSPQAHLAKIDVGLTTCGIPDGNVAVGAFIFRTRALDGDGVAVAIQSSPSTREDMDLWWASGITREAVKFSQNPAEDEVVLSVNPAGKIATTWGAIKKSMD